jgi:hypothetical protein
MYDMGAGAFWFFRYRGTKPRLKNCPLVCLFLSTRISDIVVPRSF